MIYNKMKSTVLLILLACYATCEFVIDVEYPRTPHVMQPVLR